MLSFFPRDVLDEILDLIESVSGGFPTYSYKYQKGSKGLKNDDLEKEAKPIKTF